MRIGAVTFKYALRSLTRHARRTLLSVTGVGIGCSMALLSASWMGGALEMQIRALAESSSGHLCIVHEDWPATRENTLRLHKWREVLDAVQNMDGIASFTVRARTNGLLAFGNRTAGVQMTAVLPEHERKGNRMVRRSEIEGRYLEGDDEGNVVIGKTLAKRLDVELEDDLYVTVSGIDDIHSAMLHIVGIVSTGGRELDASVCHVTLGQLERMTGIEGAAEIGILLKDYDTMGAAMSQLAGAMPGGDTVITWKEVNPAFASGAEGDQAFMRALVAMVILVVSLGIASAQLTAVLERRTEFAILSALGMKGAQVTALVMIEAVIIGVGGGLVALLIGGGGAYYLATKGVDFSSFLGGDLGFGDILFDPIVYGAFGTWLIGYALIISVVSTVLATIYPAWMATKIDPADALRIS